MYRKTYEVTGYTHNAYAFCPECADTWQAVHEAGDGMSDISLHPIFLGDEWDYAPTCDVCHTLIDCTVLSEATGE